MLKMAKWHEANNTYPHSLFRTGALIMVSVSWFSQYLLSLVGIMGDALAIIMTSAHYLFLSTTPEVWVPNLGNWRIIRFPCSRCRQTGY